MKSDRYVASGVPVIRGQNISDNRALKGEFVFVSEQTADELRSSVVFPGDLVFPHRGAIGEAAIVPGDEFDRYILSTSLMKLTCDRRLADPRFVFYFFRSQLGRDELLKYASTVGTPGIGQPLASLRSVRLLLPPLHEQRAIARVLGALDDKIEANERARRSGVEYLQTLFRELSAPTLAQVAEGDPLPPGWCLARLESVVSVLETGSRPRGGVARYSDGVPSLGAESVLGLAEYDFAKTKYVPVPYFNEMRRGIVQDRDVLLYKDGGRPGEFEPHVSLLGEGFPFTTFCINEHVYRLRAAAPISQEFLFFWLSSNPVLEEMRRRGTGVAIPGLNSRAVKDLPIAVPPNSVIDGFSEVAAPLVSLALRSSRESRTLAQLRDALLPKLLLAELRVRDAESLVEETV